jgi:hypothetical protein
MASASGLGGAGAWRPLGWLRRTGGLGLVSKRAGSLEEVLGEVLEAFAGVNGGWRRRAHPRGEGRLLK